MHFNSWRLWLWLVTRTTHRIWKKRSWKLWRLEQLSYFQHMSVQGVQHFPCKKTQVNLMRHLAAWQGAENNLRVEINSNLLNITAPTKKRRKKTFWLGGGRKKQESSIRACKDPCNIGRVFGGLIICNSAPDQLGSTGTIVTYRHQTVRHNKFN